MRAKIRGRFADTPANRSFISRLRNQLADVIKRPNNFQAVRYRSEKSARALSGQRGIGKLKFVDKGRYDKIEVKRGKLIRVREERTENGFVTVRAVQILNPGPNLLGRLKRLSGNVRSLTLRNGNIFGQIRGNGQFALHKFSEGTGLNLIQAAIRYLQEWIPDGSRGMSERERRGPLKERLLESMSVIVHKFKRDDDRYSDEDESEE